MNVSLIQVFSGLLSIGIRVSGLMLFAPFFSSVAVPSRVKAVLTIALTAMLYPMISPKIPPMTISQ